ncbi:1,4-alpha-glucan branching protein GlgB [Hoyosella sp. YIM 151337]|uniref:1,4-alpha-glucan branching protein GlgB n=1 Tax=Hoyosella sp. YIM 151337 TaxID=2992742 RepID=UPI002235AE7D|nr:1,4-alpha-glucan branching protein GlgB [Hoyosella sp. YIM 151337]MCW4354602.1 1,4-alpha-glucan branching protein GlgB [Hoyosella sp. YIM 151337]
MCHSEVSGPGNSAALPAFELEKLLTGRHSDPHTLLGSHQTAEGVTLRVLRPYASAVSLEGPGFPIDGLALTPIADGLFGTVLPGAQHGGPELRTYTVVARYADGEHRSPDGYRTPPTLGHADLALFAEGVHPRLWEILGAHPMQHGEMTGVRFAVWAPHAEGVTVTGDFDRWSGRAFPMRLLDAGVWEVFVPGATPGQLYKFRVHSASGRVTDKADPMARAAELPPATASRIEPADTGGARYTWADSIWMQSRRRGGERDSAAGITGAAARQQPLSIYEVHAGSWRKSPGGRAMGYRDLARELIPYVLDAGFTHIEFLPLTEHPFGGSWGYQVTSYYAPTARYGSPDDLKYLIDQCHRAGIGVILDWVPAHFPRDEWSLGRFDGSCLYEHPDPQRGEQPEWGTYIFDWGKPEVRNFLAASALYWLNEFHIDGLRVDAVASMLYLDYARPPGEWHPNELGGRENLEAAAFLQQLTAMIDQHCPGAITIAEDSTTWPGVTRAVALGGLGFTFKWNLRWMNDVLRYASRDFDERRLHHSELTYSLLYAWNEHYVLPISHDEVVHGKGTLWTRMPGNTEQRCAGVRALLSYMWAHPGKKLLFMGQEFGQSREWSETRGLDWFETRSNTAAGHAHAGIATLVRELNRLCRTRPELSELDGAPEGFSWVSSSDAANSVVSFHRISGAHMLVCVVNFATERHTAYRLGLPQPGPWRVLLNSDAPEFGGPAHVGESLVSVSRTPWHGRHTSAVLDLPPLTALWLEPA